jgi:hypothetical protein
MTANNFSTKDTKIIEIAEYTLKYDDLTQGLRDKTYSELVKEYGHGDIKCDCMKRTYHITSHFVKNHFDTHKHKAWVSQKQDEYIKNIGHCCSPQDIINFQNKELRNIKCNISHLTNKNKALAQENIRLEAIIIGLQNEIELLRKKTTQLEEYDDDDKFLECD